MVGISSDKQSSLPADTMEILGVTADNASSNDTMVSHMKELVMYFNGESG